MGKIECHSITAQIVAGALTTSLRRTPRSQSNGAINAMSRHYFLWVQTLDDQHLLCPISTVSFWYMYTEEGWSKDSDVFVYGYGYHFQHAFPNSFHTKIQLIWMLVIHIKEMPPVPILQIALEPEMIRYSLVTNATFSWLAHVLSILSCMLSLALIVLPTKVLFSWWTSANFRKCSNCCCPRWTAIEKKRPAVSANNWLGQSICTSRPLSKTCNTNIS